MHRRAEEINETTKQWVRHRGLKLVLDHAEVVKCDISATANTLKSRDTPNLLSPISNIRAVTLKLYSRALSSRVEIRPAESLPRCSTVPAASFNEGFYEVALICVFEARRHRATSRRGFIVWGVAQGGVSGTLIVGTAEALKSRVILAR